MNTPSWCKLCFLAGGEALHQVDLQLPESRPRLCEPLLWIPLFWLPRISGTDALSHLADATWHHERHFSSLRECRGRRIFLGPAEWLKVMEMIPCSDFSSTPFIFLQESKEATKWHFECQHGKEECLGNMIEVRACRITDKSENTDSWGVCVCGGDMGMSSWSRSTLPRLQLGKGFLHLYSSML